MIRAEWLLATFVLGLLAGGVLTMGRPRPAQEPGVTVSGPLLAGFCADIEPGDTVVAIENSGETPAPWVVAVCDPRDECEPYVLAPGNRLEILEMPGCRGTGRP